MGILGGTFDPIHYGHLVAGEEARCALGLERILFVPSARPPHKQDYTVSPPDVRVEMVRLAIAGNPGFELSTIDVDRPGFSYTVDTIALLQQQLGPEANLFFILGEDALADLPTWHEPEKLLDTCQLIAVNRPGYHSFSLRLLERQLPGVERRVHPVRIPELAIWSTELRARVASGLPIRYLVPHAVHDYIYQHGLYLNPEPQPHPPAA
ncbi:MAG TPA: nicotinate-nucleotide adenylyltransferase [Chloroflexota bacterium]|nr:nicotinate-nucleotide adenylyltransferase [Chloroflexota bacterium]